MQAMKVKIESMSLIFIGLEVEVENLSAFPLRSVEVWLGTNSGYQSNGLQAICK